LGWGYGYTCFPAYFWHWAGHDHGCHNPGGKWKYWSGYFPLFFYLVLSLTMEYVFKPKLVGDQVKMHTLLVFLSIIGGLNAYGVLGIIYGPLIVTAFLTLSDIYLNKYDDYVQSN
jgi:predicted PurR-regulated permease PerM